MMKVHAYAAALLLGLTMTGVATDLNASLEYLFPHADPEQAWVLQDDSDGKGPYIARWNLDVPAPTLAQLRAVSAIAAQWKADRDTAARADFEAWEDQRMKAVVQLLLEEINLLRAELGLPARTPAQVKSMIRTKMDAQADE